ncbi:Rieske 2Fe-2S domain-containing protein [Nesterenkonia pannonica]|uniref:Rieske 2Fe-2S domain-containing protein n=1 Tax=Nesterenkonia pannonica TaxID=1548602 RepID=UPI0021645227|nr:Rieske 2Fe-2S domain-containing protein [Nesterenkonia pannonica]
MSCFTGCSPRRQFLRGALLGAGALSLTACGGGRDSEDASDDQDWTDIAPAESLPVGEAGIAEVGEHTLLVNRPDEDSVMVFSAVCPHEGARSAWTRIASNARATAPSSSSRVSGSPDQHPVD